MSYTVSVAAGDLPCLPYVLDVWAPGEAPLVAARLCLTRAGAERAGSRAVQREQRRLARAAAPRLAWRPVLLRA